MKQHLAVSAIGSDRTGMVHDLTRVILLGLRRDPSSESRMASLGNEFAMLVLVSGNWHSLASLAAELARLGSQGLRHERSTEPGAALAAYRKPSTIPIARGVPGPGRHRHQGFPGFCASRGIVDIAESLHPHLSRGGHGRADVRGTR